MPHQPDFPPPDDLLPKPLQKARPEGKAAVPNGAADSKTATGPMVQGSKFAVGIPHSCGQIGSAFHGAVAALPHTDADVHDINNVIAGKGVLAMVIEGQQGMQ